MGGLDQIATKVIRFLTMKFRAAFRSKVAQADTCGFRIFVKWQDNEKYTWISLLTD